MIYTKTESCRLCKGKRLDSILNLGMQHLTGVFPKKDEKVEAGPLELSKCADCHLVQLAHNYDLSKLYGEHYGYRSGLNSSMVEHLKRKVDKICSLVSLQPNDLVVDIGSNDGTTLGHYDRRDLKFVGIDPSGSKFKKYYKDDVELVPDFFSNNLIEHKFPGKKAKVITSFAMFYDLEDPIQFVREIASVLAQDGIWVFEQSYLPLMIDTMAYDTVCHEHLEYYGLHQIKQILEAAELQILDVEFNDVNGGSFSISASHKSTSLKARKDIVADVLQQEIDKGYTGIDLFKKFASQVTHHRDELKKTVSELISRGHAIHGYGASTKGNVILQYCGFTKNEIKAIAEVNEDKFGRFTPGTNIPILSEAESRRLKPSVYLVLPWHFKKNILTREAAYIRESGVQFLFPLPKIHLVNKDSLDQHLA